MAFLLAIDGLAVFAPTQSQGKFSGQIPVHGRGRVGIPAFMHGHGYLGRGFHAVSLACHRMTDLGKARGRC